MLLSILVTMLAAGVVGGLINSCLADPAVETPLKPWQHVVVGIGASFLVPVFLNMISSQLIPDAANAQTDADRLSKLLLLGGFCLLAAISSRTFIRTLTSKLLEKIAQANTAANQATTLASEAKATATEAQQSAKWSEDIADLTVEPDVAEPAAKMAVMSLAAEPPVALSEDEKKVLGAMAHSTFTMRASSGIAQDTGMPAEEVNQLLDTLMGKFLVVRGVNKEGQPRWYVTASGRQALDGAKG